MRARYLPCCSFIAGYLQNFSGDHVVHLAAVGHGFWLTASIFESISPFATHVHSGLQLHSELGSELQMWEADVLPAAYRFGVNWIYCILWTKYRYCRIYWVLVGSAVVVHPDSHNYLCSKCCHYQWGYELTLFLVSDHILRPMANWRGMVAQWQVQCLASRGSQVRSPL